MIKDPSCKNKNWKMDELDQAVFGEILKLGLAPEMIEQLYEESKSKKTEEPDRIATIEKEIGKIDAQISRFMDLYGEGVFTTEQINGKVNPLNEQRKGLQSELDKLNVAEGRLSVEEATEIATSFAEVLEGGDFNEIRATIEMLVKYIEIDNEEVKIYWKFA